MWFESVQMSSFTLFPTKWCENKDLTWNKAKFILKISFWSNLSTRKKMFFAVRCCSLSLLIPRPGNLGGERWGVSGQHPNPKCRVEGRWMAEGLDGIYRTSLIVPSKVDHHWSLNLLDALTTLKYFLFPVCWNLILAQDEVKMGSSWPNEIFNRDVMGRKGDLLGRFIFREKEVELQDMVKLEVK